MMSRIGAIVFLSRRSFSREVDPLLGRQGRPEARIDVAAHDDVGDVEARQQQAGKDRADKQFAERLLRHDGVNDRHHRRRNEDAKCAACEQGAAGKLLVVAALEHGRQGDHAHGDFGRADHTDHGG